MKTFITWSFPRGIVFLLILLVVSPSSFAAEPEHKILPLRLGGSQVIEIQQPSYKMKVLTSDDEVVQARPLTANKIYVHGKKLGYCTITVWDEKEKEVRATIDVTVTLDLTGLKERLRELYPNQKIDVYGSETGVVLSGTVSSPEIVDQVLRLTRTFLPKAAKKENGGEGVTGHSGAGITNLLNVEGIQQVMLEVKFAEVSRNSGKDWQAALGLGNLGDVTAAASAGGSVLGPLKISGQFPFPDLLNQSTGSLLLNFAGNPANIFVNIDNFTTALNLLETEGMARILAEPRLVTQSGQEASFLAGGEFPIPVPQAGSNGGTTITIEYKEFGVALRFTPVVLSDGKISLRVAPSVSEIASVSQIPSGITGATFNVPNLNTRKLQTTVQLNDGQTLALAGLLQDNLREDVRKIPGLGDIPILGPLFRSTSYTQQKTDLLVAVTPHLVKPVKEGSLHFPGESMTPPNEFQYYLEGRLEGTPTKGSSTLKRHNFLPPPAAERSGGLEGSFGYQAVHVK